MGTSSEDPEGRFVFDEAFVASAGIKEPSARERRGNPLTRRLAERRRRKEMIRQWRVPRSARGRPGARALTVALVVGVVAAGAVLAEADPLGMRPPRPAGTAPLTLVPAPVLSPAPGDAGTGPGEAFAGSPAQSYADGAAGFTFPAARATAGFSAAEIRLLLARTRALLTASHLDPGTLFGGRTDTFTRRLDPEQRSAFTRSLRSRDPTRNLRSWLMNFAPGTAEPTGSVVKVHGATTLAQATRQGHRGALVKVNYVFVYPVHRPGLPATTIPVIAHLRGEVFHSRDARGEWTWIYRWESSTANARCDVEDGYVHPFFAGSPPDLTDRTGAPVDPYDLNEDPGPGCQTVSHT
ncbi:hypothetical protein ACRYCC_13455 [Actinomadura scrupuli]|uniref:SCO2583/SCO2584 N-terminal domain-containing protein n=1 Tax=Actinomadura scrupuli TaxID=559629 RepID=UPI003D975675